MIIRKDVLMLMLGMFLLMGHPSFVVAEPFVLASNGSPRYCIVSYRNSSSVEEFACKELKTYLDQMGKTSFFFSDKLTEHSIVVCSASSLLNSAPDLEIPFLREEEYGIFKRAESLYLVGGSNSAVLYAVYCFLSKLGCQWIAPGFDFYEGKEQYIPIRQEMVFNYSSDLIRKPSMKYRKLYVENGRSHNSANLKELIDWMPKVRYNTLVVPLDYEGKGRVRWDNWRTELTPELEKRSITIEVGGHGYQNFLNAKMEDGQLYKNNTEWFGLDKNGECSSDPQVVFCTSNSQARSFLHNKILAYLKARPEIEIFDFWPPDSEIWCSCSNCLALGSATDRHALLVSQTARFLQNELPKVKMECLAYNRYVEPPQHEVLNKSVLLDFCPIDQNFEYQIYQDSSENNKTYKKNLLSWLNIFDGDISIYSYYRKYAWRSLPNVMPHYIQNDLQFYRDLGIKGVSVYSEPGDWFTYGLNHYVLGNLAWNPDVSVDSLIWNYSTVLYGPATEIAISVYNELESIVRYGCKIPHTIPKSVEQYDTYNDRLRECLNQVNIAANHYLFDDVLHNHLHRLGLMLEYAQLSILEMKAKAEDDKDGEEKIAGNIKKVMRDNSTLGIFIPH